MLPCVRAEGPFVCKAGIKSQLSQRLSFYLSSRRLKVPDSILRYLRPEFNFDLIDDYTQSKLEKENLSKSIF